MDTGDEIMTLAEVAEYLHLAEKTVVRMAQRKEIPAAKMGSQWRFVRSVVRERLVSQMTALAPLPSLSAGSEGSSGPAASRLELRDVLHPSLMNMDIAPGPKEAVLRQLVAPLCTRNMVKDARRLLDRMLERETIATTGMGHGVAFPHPRRPEAGMFSRPAIVVGVCPEGTDFGAIDNQTVRVFFLICATSESTHLRLMAEAAWLSRLDAVSRLPGIRRREDAWELLIAEAEAARPARKQNGIMP